MRLRTALAGAALTGGLLLAPGAAYASDDGTTVVTVLFTHNCNRTTDLVIANITDQVAKIQINGKYGVDGIADNGDQFLDVAPRSGKPVKGVVPFEAKPDGTQPTVRVAILNGKIAGTGGVTGAVDTWIKPSGCDKPEPPVAPTQTKTSSPGAKVTYANCDDVRAHHAAPIRPGDPGWDKKLDRDNDGIGCEDGEHDAAPEPKTTTHPPVAAAKVETLPVTGPGGKIAALATTLIALGAGLKLGARRRRRVKA